MSDRGQFTTHLIWHDSRGSEVEAEVRVTYSRYVGYRGSLTEPPEPASVEIVLIIPKDSDTCVPERFFEDDELIAECMEDWASEEEEAAEWRAQSRRDRLMEGF